MDDRHEGETELACLRSRNYKRVKEKPSVTKENPIVIEDREELIYMLSEAVSFLSSLSRLWHQTRIKHSECEERKSGTVRKILDRLPL